MSRAATCWSGTSHFLGQNFSTAYDISFTNRENQREFCWTTSWGMSTRMVGGLIMAHGDDRGLIVPPRIAPTQVVVVPIFRTDEDRARVEAYIETWERSVRAEVRLKVDWSDSRPGEKFNHWELKGVPLRLAVGPRDVEAHEAQLADRLTGEKRQVPAAGLFEILPRELKKFQAALYQRAVDFRAENTFEVATLQELLDHFKERTGFVWAPWCGSEECEARVKDESGGVTIRNFDPDEKPSAECLVCGRPAVYRVAFARAY